MKICLAALILSSTPAIAQQCASTQAVIETLSKYGEQRVFVGQMSSEQVVEVWANPQTQTWTTVVTSATGVSCLMAAGEGFNSFPFPPNL